MYTFDLAVAPHLFQSLSLGTPSSQLGPVNCCACCNPIIAAKGNVDLSKVRDAENGCQFCALLLHTLKPDSEEDQANIQITREQVGQQLALRLGRKGLLWICPGMESSGHFHLLRRWFHWRRESHTADEDPRVSEMALPATPPAHFTLLREWLRRCDKSHSCKNHSVETKAFLPTRLLYVDNTNDPDYLRLDLATGIDEAKYIALSHRWGVLSDDEKKEFCTTTDNIDQRLVGFNISDLPKTFQDAIKVTRELHVSYLWIDSLCIIQAGDNGKDWESESRRMESVFSSAYCTIAATSARDMKDGFLDREVSPEYLYVRDISGRRFYICAGTGDFEVDVDKAELNTRAWVMQERVLSRRTIHFSANQMYWECGEGVYYENLTEMKSSLRKTHFMLDPNFPNRLLYSGRARTIEFIHFLCEDYSKRGLTKETDRCVAISGLEARIAGALKCRSRHGIFQWNIHRNLLWQASNNKMGRIKYPGRKVPSWSWMAYTGGVQFMKIPFGSVVWIDNLRFDKERKLALVADVGKFRNCTTEPDEKRHAILDYSGVKRGWIQYDVEEIEDLSKVRCVVIGRYKEIGQIWSAKQYYMLVVKPTSVDSDYDRVGSGTIHRDYVVMEAADMRIV